MKNRQRILLPVASSNKPFSGRINYLMDMAIGWDGGIDHPVVETKQFDIHGVFKLLCCY